MALQKQVIPIPFAQGVDTKSDPKQVMPGKLLSLFNGVFQSAKRILKRFGYKALSTTTQVGNTISNGISVNAYKDELTEIDGSNFYTYSNSNSKWSDVGPMIPCEISSDEIVAANQKIFLQDSTFHPSGFYGYGYIWKFTPATTSMDFVITDDTTKSIIFHQTVLGNSEITGCKVQYVGNYILLIYSEAASTSLNYFAIDVTNPTVLIGPTTIATDFVQKITSKQIFDCVLVNNNLYVCYNSAGATKIAFHYISPTLVNSVRKPAATGTDIPDGGLSINGDASNNIWLVYASDSIPAIKCSIYSEFIASVVQGNTTVPGGNTDVVNIEIIILGIVGRIFWTECPTTIGNNVDEKIRTNTMDITGLTGTASTYIGQCIIYSKAFISGGHIYLPVLFPSETQPTVFIIDDNKQPISKVLSLNISWVAPDLTTGFLENDRPPMQNTNFISGTTHEFASIAGATEGSLNAETLVSGLLNSSTITLPTKPTSSTIANNLYLSGGQLWMYDGDNIVESGFNTFPDFLIATDGGAGGSLQAGVYGYQIIYEWIDATGNHHRSAPSPLVSVTIAANNSFALLTYPALTLTEKTNVFIGIYRTSVNGTTLRRVSGLSFKATNPGISQTVGPIIEAVSDAFQAGGDILYTQGGELENISTPSNSCIFTYRSRLILFQSEVQNSFWYSKEIVPGFPAEFSDSLVQNIDELGGAPITGIQMDDKMIIFKEKNIFYMTGTGPSSAGTNNDFTTPLLINSDVGCVDKNSVVLMPNGVMFKSHKGIYLLDRSLQASYIGADIEIYNSISVTSAHLMQEVNQVRFSLASSANCLVYDYYFNQWSVFSNISAVDSCVFEGNYTYLKSDGTVMEETPDLYLDDTSQIPLSGRTAWLSFAGVQGFQRIYKALFLGQQRGDHSLLIDVSYDFDPTVVQSDTIDATAISPTVYQWRIFPIRQKCEAIQFAFVDSQIAPFNEGFSISDLTLEVGIKSGADKLPASQSFG